MSEIRVHFIRHGEANAYAEGGDFNRGLTATGRLVTRKVAQLLAREISGLDKIFTSPLVRAVQTTEIIASCFDCDDEIEAHPLIANPSSIEDILHLVTSQSAATDHIAIVGHEPTLSHVVSHLLMASSNPAPWMGFRTSQVVSFRYHQTQHEWAFAHLIHPQEPKLSQTI